MAQSSVALKQSFTAPTETGLQPVIRGQMLRADRADEYQEDLDAINLAVQELINLEARGQRLDIHVEDVKTNDALETVAERFREFGLSNRFSETIIAAIEECAVANGTDFARKNKANLLSVHLMLTDQKPELKKGRSHFMIAFDGKQKHGASYSTVQMHYTSSGTKITTTSMPDLETMFVSKTKYLVFSYEGLDGEALNSPENVQADLAAVATEGGLPAEAIEELQAAIDNGTATPEQIELIQTLAELVRVTELSATPGAIEQPAAAIQQLKETIAQLVQGEGVLPALAAVSAELVQKADRVLAQQGTLEIVADNDNNAPEDSGNDVMAVLEQAGLDDAMTVTLSAEHQGALRDFLEQADMPAEIKAQILEQISEGSLERASFTQIETTIAKSDASVPAEMVTAMSEIRDIVAAQDKILPALAEQKVFLNEAQQQALKDIIADQNLPADIVEKITEQIQTRAVSVETIAVLSAVANQPVLDGLKADARQMVRDQQGQLHVPVHVPLTPMVKDAVINVIGTIDIPASVKADYTSQVHNETPTRALVTTIVNGVPPSPAINAFHDQSTQQFRREDRAVIAGKIEDYTKNLPANTPPETKAFLKDVVKDIQGGQNISASQRLQILAIDPNLAKKINAFQSFETPVRDQKALVREVENIQKVLLKTDSVTAKAVSNVLERMKDNPRQADKIFTSFVGSLPDGGHIREGLKNAAIVVQNKTTEFQPRNPESRDRLLVDLAKALPSVPADKQESVKEIIRAVELGNPISKENLDIVAEVSSDVHTSLSENIKPKKPDESSVKSKCDDPCGGDCENCGKAFGRTKGVTNRFSREGSEPKFTHR